MPIARSRTPALPAALLLSAGIVGCGLRFETIQREGESVLTVVNEAYFAYQTVSDDKRVLGWLALIRVRPGTTDLADVVQLSPPGVEPDTVEGKPADIRGTIEGRTVAEPGTGGVFSSLTVASSVAGGATTQVRLDGRSRFVFEFGDGRPGAATPDAVREALVILGESDRTRERADCRDWFREYAFDEREDPQVRVAALTALRNNRLELSEDELARLRRCMNPNNDPWVRAEAAACLGVYRHPRGADRLAAAVKDDRDPVVRAAAVRALGKYSINYPPEYAARLVQQAQSAVDPESRAAALRTLADLAVDRRPGIAQILTLDLDLNDPGRFAFKHEQSLSLIELTGETAVGRCPNCRYDKWVWRRLLAADTAFARGGTVDPRQTPEQSGLKKFGDFWYRTYRLIRKEPKPEE